MTGIVIDRFKGKLYAFADGRVTEDDFIFTDEDLKITKLDDDNLMTMCGEAVIIDQCIELFNEGKLDTDNVRKVTGSGAVIWLSVDKVRVIDIDNKQFNMLERADDPDKVAVNNNGMSSYPLTALPMFFGSGKKPLSGAYYALDLQKASDEKEYTARMRKAYKAASTHIISMGPLKQTETIIMNKDKGK